MEQSQSGTMANLVIDEGLVARTLNEVLGHDVDDADIYFERVESDGLSLEEGMVKEAGRSVHQGAGIRAVSGDRTG